MAKRIWEHKFRNSETKQNRERRLKKTPKRENYMHV